MESENKSTIFISNLPRNVTESNLKEIFENFGICVSCELDLEKSCAYFEFDNELSVEKALAMDNIAMGSSLIRVSKGFQEKESTDESISCTLKSDKIDYTKSVQIFIGGLGYDVDESMLIEGFSKFGKILETKVIRLPDGKHRGFAFIVYSNEVDAENAIQSMNNTTFHNRNIKCNWATKSKNANGNGQGRKLFDNQQLAKSPEEISMEAPQSNTSVYVTGENLTEDILRPCFEQYGKIKNIKAYPEKNHAFINYDSHDAAAYAIYHMNGFNVKNRTLKCNWSKKSTGLGNNANDNRNMDSYYMNNYQQQYFDNSHGQQFLNNGNQQQYGQYYQSTYQNPQFQQQQQQQYYNNSNVFDYYNVQAQNYGAQQHQHQQQQYPYNYNTQQQHASMNSQSYPQYGGYNNHQQ